MCASPIAAWTGPLDVSSLAMETVTRTALAAERMGRARGIDLPVDTTPSLVAASFAAIDHLRIDGRPVEAWGEFSGFFAADDGWVRLHGNYPHHRTAVRRALDVADRGGAAAAIGRLPAAEAVERILARGGIATRVRSREGWRSHPQSRATHHVPWHRIEAGDERTDPPVGRATAPGNSMSSSRRAVRLPLHGVRVLDLTRVVAGPMATQALACLGADVLRIDPPDRPELREAYLASGMGKRSAELDLAASRERLDALLPMADVVVLGYRPGALARFGLEPDGLRERFGHLVIGVLSAWGEAGPWGDRAGFDSIVQAAAGIADVYASTSDALRRPGALPVQALDHTTGHVLAAGILDLLREGRSGVVRAHLLGAARALLDRPTQGAPNERDVESAEPGPATPGGAFEQVTPYGRVRTVPVPLRLDGMPLTGAITAYGTAPARWR